MYSVMTNLYAEDLVAILALAIGDLEILGERRQSSLEEKREISTEARSLY